MFNPGPMEIMNSLKTVMITHYQSSGSLYLHSLFDGHPQVISIPGVPELDAIINGRFNNAQEALNEFYDTNPKLNPMPTTVPNKAAKKA